MKYGITAKPSTLVKPVSNAVLERIHEVLGNLVRNFNISTKTYVEKMNRGREFYLQQCLQFAQQLIG